MQVLPTGFQSIEAIALAGLFLFGVVAGNLVVVILALVLVAIVLPHRLAGTKRGNSEFSV